jgi:hypothetical protein
VFAGAGHRADRSSILPDSLDVKRSADIFLGFINLNAGRGERVRVNAKRSCSRENLRYLLNPGVFPGTNSYILS